MNAMSEDSEDPMSTGNESGGFVDFGGYTLEQALKLELRNPHRIKAEAWVAGDEWDRECAVRMNSSMDESTLLSEILLRVPEDVRERLHDQIWLRMIFQEQRKRTGVTERAAFDTRSDRLLEALDPQEEL